jgi:hypothetical protein
VYLERTRLDIVCDHPTDARQSLEPARQLIDETGYHRRDEDVEELDAVIDAAPHEPKGDPTVKSTLWREPREIATADPALAVPTC